MAMRPPSSSGSIRGNHRRLLGLALLAGLGPAAPLGAQQGPVREALDRLAVELAAESSPRDLKIRIDELRDSSDDPDREALRRIQRGLMLLRVAELGGDLLPPAGEFARATNLRADWVYGWYGWGRAKQLRGNWLAGERLNLGQRVGFGSYEEAAQHYVRALEVEPDFVPALRELSVTITQIKDTARLHGLLLPALRRTTTAANDTTVLLSRIAAERTHGDPRQALDAAYRYLLATDPSARGYRELAWAGFLASDPAAEGFYYEGAALDDPVGVAAYREDLALIADDSALARFDLARGPERVEFLRRFWLERDRAALRPEGERLVEHYRRIAEAERRFGLEVNRRYYHGWDSYRSGSLRFDDRGIVYIRHGEPDDTVSSVTFGLPPNLTWRYAQADGDLLLHFAANPGTYDYGTGGDLHDYRLVPSLWAIMILPGGGSAQPALELLLESRCPIYEPYCKYNGWGRFGRAEITRAEQEAVAMSTAIATESDGHELRLARRLIGDAALFAVGSEGGRPMVHAVWRLLMLRPPGIDSTLDIRTSARVRFAIFDSTGQSVGWVDTTVALAARATSDTVIVPGRVAVTVPPGSWRYRLAIITDDSTGRVFPTGSVAPKPADGRRLVLSDLVLGRRDVSVPWAATGADTAWFTPGERWQQGDVLEVYHEIYGLAHDEPYHARLVVRRGRRVVLTLGWEGRAAAGVTRVARTLDFASLRPGDYRLEIEITSASGARVTSSRPLQIRGPKQE